LAPQGALGQGSVTDDLLQNNALLADRAALDDAVAPLPPGVYDLVTRFEITDPNTRVRQFTTEIRSVFISAGDDPHERGARTIRQMQTVSRDIVKKGSHLEVRMVGALLFPAGEQPDIPVGPEPEIVPPPTDTAAERRRARSEAARKGWETRRQRLEEAAAAERAAQEEADTRKRQARARKAAVTRKANRTWEEEAAAFFADMLSRPVRRKPRKASKAKPKAKAKARKGKGRKRGR